MDCENICYRIRILVSESQNCINLLYSTPCTYSRNIILSQLKAKMAEISFLSSTVVCSQESQIKNTLIQEQNQQNQRDLTIQELTKFNGKDGNPAYVAVNGIVYDVTDNAAWAAASHFGLTAGKDLSSEFASCHSGKAILSKLKVIGKLV